MYKSLWMVEQLFRSLKSILQTRPIYRTGRCFAVVPMPNGRMFCAIRMPDRQEEAV